MRIERAVAGDPRVDTFYFQGHLDEAATVMGIVVASRTTPFCGPTQRKSSSAYASCRIWMRLPQVSSKVAVVTSPISVGSCAES